MNEHMKWEDAPGFGFRLYLGVSISAPPNRLEVPQSPAVHVCGLSPSSLLPAPTTGAVTWHVTVNAK